MKTSIIILFSFFFLQLGRAQDSDTLKKKRPHFELSFGKSLLFISTSKQADLLTNSAVIVPTTAILFFAELRPNKQIRIPLFCNLPTETKQFLINGELISEKASTTLGTGLQFKIFQFKVDSKSKIECTLGPLASFIIDTKSHIRVAPIFAGRLRVIRSENIVMYLGFSYSVGVDAFGILYGTGTIF